MVDREQKQRFIDRMQRRAESVAEGDERLWRHPLAAATVELLQEGSPVTIDSLIERLEVLGADDQPDVLMRRAASQAAIDRLREIVAKQD